MSDAQLVLENLLKCKTRAQMLKTPWQTLMERPKHAYSSKVRIVIVNTPCMGFGDVVFAMKLYQYLKKWYPKTSIHIATTQVENFVKLGMNRRYLRELSSTGIKNIQCRRVSRLSIENGSGRVSKTSKDYDLILVAPITADFAPSHRDVRTMFPNSTRFNTFFFSEYNDSITKDFDFPTGVGEGRMGLLFTDVKKAKKLPILRNPYTLIYITDNDRNAVYCYQSFIKMVTKAQRHPLFDIIVPMWVANNLLTNASALRAVDKAYQTVRIVFKDRVETLLETGKKGLVLQFRADVLPLPYDDMMKVYQHSVRQILVTGDQSITDVLSCCYKSLVPSYQIVPWKRDLARNLAKYLPQKYISSIKTACGTVNAINYKPNMTKFMKLYDFRQNARPKLDAIVRALSDKAVREMMNVVDSNLSVRSIKALLG
jgi:hypothetical protein